jgi:hypothetical protein
LAQVWLKGEIVCVCVRVVYPQFDHSLVCTVGSARAWPSTFLVICRDMGFS